MLQDDDILEEQASDNIHDIIEENETDNEKPYSPVSESHLQDDSELNVEKQISHLDHISTISILQTLCL